MLVNNINCSKPRRNGNFQGNKTPKNAAGKVRYKHYEEISDEVLAVRSIVQAHKQAENSKKMQLYKATPGISAAIIGAGIALTQPGKLATKVAAGLGFLALYKATDVILDMFKNQDNENDTPIEDALLSTAIVATSAAGAFSLAKKAGNCTKIGKFVKKELNILSKEINSTKTSKFVEKNIEPFMEKHRAKVNMTATIGSLGVAVGSGLAQAGLLKSIGKDIQINAQKNFSRAKIVKKAAKEHFDSIDAVEV